MPAAQILTPGETLGGSHTSWERLMEALPPVSHNSDTGENVISEKQVLSHDCLIRHHVAQAQSPLLLRV